MVIVGLGLAAVAAEPLRVREATTVQIAGSYLPLCRDDGGGGSGCRGYAVGQVRADHRLPSRALLSWDLISMTEVRHGVGTSWRGEVAIGAGFHRDWTWGDLRLYAGPSLEVHAPWPEATSRAVDPGDADVAYDVGVVLKNDMDVPLGPLRLGIRWRWRLGQEVAWSGADEAAREDARGIDVAELHALAIGLPAKGPVGVYAEVGWTSTFTVPFTRPPIVARPWAIVGIEGRLGAPRER